MSKKSVRDTFEKYAAGYDRMIERVIPYYHEQHKIILSLVPFPRRRKIKIVDLGIGTGVISSILLAAYPNSTAHGVDVSKKMIEVCSKQLRKFKKRLSLSCADIEKSEYATDYDVAVAGLAIHHLMDRAKERFFKKIWFSLRRGGVFIIRDIIKSESERMNKLYHKKWCEFERKNGIDPRKIEDRTKKNDIPATAENHITWLKKAGFKDVDCVWKYNNFAVFVAYK